MPESSSLSGAARSQGRGHPAPGRVGVESEEAEVTPGLAWFAAAIAGFTAVVGALGCFIAWRQWRTAHERVVLDLFDRRFQVAADAQKVVGPVMANGRSDLSDLIKIGQVQARARFLFGDDVNDYLETIRVALIDVQKAQGLMEDDSSTDRKAAVELKYKRLSEISKFYEAFPPLCEPYMKMDQKMAGKLSDRLFGWCSGVRGDQRP
jgi:hypothetical protein